MVRISLFDKPSRGKLLENEFLVCVRLELRRLAKRFEQLVTPFLAHLKPKYGKKT